MSLTGKRVVVTGGGGRGMGFQLVRMFRNEGAHVVACDISDQGLDVVRAQLPDVVTVVADIGSAAGCDQLLEAAGQVVDVLCNHAGTSERIGPVHEVDEDEWERVMAVNVTAAFRLSRRVIPGMIERGGGVIINTASVAGLRGARGGPAYTASKFGLVGLTQNIAATYAGDGIRCNAICPGPMGPLKAAGTRAEDMPGVSTERGRAMLARDGGKPEGAMSEEVAALAVFLAGDEASRINGACIPVDSGWIAY